MGGNKHYHAEINIAMTRFSNIFHAYHTIYSVKSKATDCQNGLRMITAF